MMSRWSGICKTLEQLVSSKLSNLISLFNRDRSPAATTSRSHIQKHKYVWMNLKDQFTSTISLFHTHTQMPNCGTEFWSFSETPSCHFNLHCSWTLQEDINPAVVPNPPTHTRTHTFTLSRENDLHSSQNVQIYSWEYVLLLAFHLLIHNHVTDMLTIFPIGFSMQSRHKKCLKFKMSLK